ncbi:MAG: hypothetical protein WC069_06540 [Candidatus Shapirobacteria bacterium]
MPITLAVGQALPRHDTYISDSTARAFWRLTFKTGRNYIYGVDAMGQKVLAPHERENEGYQRRLRMTKPRNHSGPIIRRYNNHVFRIEANRPEDAGDLYAMMIDDVDGNGSSMAAFMARALEVAQVERESYIMLDTTKEYDGEMSKAQADAVGARPVFKIIYPDSVINWTEYNDGLTSVLIQMVRENGDNFACLYDKKTKTEIELQPDGAGGYRVKSVGSTEAHGYIGLPVVRLRPFCDESQISPLAESQQLITNLQSWLIEEMGNITFSQMVASGVAATEVKDAKVGNNRLICLPNPASTITIIGADPAQAASLSSAIQDEQRELYRIAGISADDPTKSGSPESGIAKAFKHNDLSANLAALANSVEEAENQAMHILFDSVGEEYPGDAKYPDEFDLPSIADDLSEIISIVTVSALPSAFKKKLCERFAQRHLSLDESEKAEFESELEQLGNDALTNQPSGMQGT